MNILWWFWEKVREAVATTRPITVRGSDDTTFSIAGSNDTSITVRGSDDTTITIVGSSTMSKEQHISFHQGESISVTVTGVSMTGKTVVATIRDGEDNSVLATSTATISAGIPTATLTRAQTLEIPDGRDDGLKQLQHVWDMACTTAGSEAVLAHGKATCKISPTLQT